MLMKQPPSSDREQLAAAALASVKLLLVSLALIVVIVALFCRSVLSLLTVALAACSLLCSWMIDRVVGQPDVRECCRKLAAGR